METLRARCGTDSAGLLNWDSSISNISPSAPQIPGPWNEMGNCWTWTTANWGRFLSKDLQSQVGHGTLASRTQSLSVFLSSPLCRWAFVPWLPSHGVLTCQALTPLMTAGGTQGGSYSLWVKEILPWRPRSTSLVSHCSEVGPVPTVAAREAVGRGVQGRGLPLPKPGLGQSRLISWDWE